MPYPRIEVRVYYRGGRKSTPPIIQNSDIATAVVRNICNRHTLLWVEEVLMLCLNSANMLIGWYRVAIGGIDTASLDTRVIATIALKCTAVSIILAHNHPSGNLLPSKADIESTIRIRDGLDILGIKLKDHIILSENQYLSMKEQGYI